MGKAAPLAATLTATFAATATLVLVILSSQPPAPRGEDAPATSFSAARAQRTLDRLAQGLGPHPVGSKANALLRERLLASLGEAGYEAEVEASFACGASGVCARVENVVAWRGADLAASAGKAVLLACHYDSVPAGPGAADDLSAVAIALESARSLALGRHRNPVVFLFTDAEEVGLLGAEAFAASGRLAPRVGAVVNLEARGTSGESFLFETSDQNGWLVSRVARALPHPATSSLFPTVYRALPNDTDFTVFRRRGWPGVNFAFIGSAALYHTPRDVPASLDAATFQHQGENALAAVGALADADLAPTPKGDAVWFSLFERWVVSWPEAWTLPFALAGIALLLAATVLSLRRRVLSLRSFLVGLAFPPAALLAGAAAGLAASRLILARWGDPSWIATPLPAVVLSWSAGLGAASLAAALLAPRCGAAGLRTGAAAWFALLSLAAALLAPGASFLVLVPALVLSAARLASAAARVPDAPLDAAGALAAGAVIFPVAWVLYDAMGIGLLPGIACLVALASVAFVPALAEGPAPRHLVPLLAGAVALLSLGLSLVLPARGEKAPAPLNVVHLDRDGRPSWIVPDGALSLAPAMRGSAAWTRPGSSPFPWWEKARYLTGPALPSGAPRPLVHISGESTADGLRRLTLRVSSPRRASRLRLAFEDRALVRSVSIGGTALPPLDRLARRFGGRWIVVSHLTLPPEGATVEVAVPAGSVLRGWVVDETPDLPEGGLVIQGARGKRAGPVGDGDRSVAMAPFGL